MGLPHRLYIFIEGNDDERFFEKIIRPRLERHFDLTELWKYSEKTPQKLGSYIRAINSMGGDYIYVADIDDAPCITAKKNRVRSCCPQIDQNNIAVVVKEIEGWYVAGIDNSAARRLGMHETYLTTDNITKEQFNQLIPVNMTRTEFMIKIIKNYNLETARQKNRSIRYFLTKWMGEN